ncbi:MAG: hypothetical protein AAB737_02325, partial [Patescibacteria group bacterium]
MSVATFQNYKGANPGKLNNTSTVTVSSTFDNSGFATDSVNNNAGGIIDLTGAAGTYTNGAGATVNNTATSTMKLTNTITNGAGAITTTNGTFEYKSVLAQTVFSGVAGSTYGNLTITGASTKSLGGSTTVGTQVTINVGATLAEGAANTLTLNGASPITGTGTLTADGTTIYNGAAQSVFGATYNNLTLQNGNTKTAGGGVTVNGALTSAASTTFDLSTNSLITGASSSISNNASGIIRTQGDVTFGAVHTIAGAFIYEKATLTQNVGTANYTNLTMSGGAGATGQKNFPAGTVNVSGVYSATGANRNYGAGTFAYNSTTAQTVFTGESYNNLTIANATDTSAANYKSANGNLSVGAALAINASNTLDMGSNSFTTLGSGTNSGKIRWAASNSHVVGGTGTTEFYGSSAGAV